MRSVEDTDPTPYALALFEDGPGMRLCVVKAEDKRLKPLVTMAYINKRVRHFPAVMEAIAKLAEAMAEMIGEDIAAIEATGFTLLDPSVDNLTPH